MSDGGEEAGPRIRRGVVFITVALALFMMSLDSTVVATALHTLQEDLGTTLNWSSWTLTAYSFGFVIMLPVSGRLSERLGRRKVFVASLVIFTAASLGCGLSDNIYVLIVMRALQAAGGAGFTPSATGIVVDYFGGARDRAVSLFGSVFPIGAMIGPVLGGLLVDYWSWRYVFFINVPIGALILFLTLRFVPQDRKRHSGDKERADIAGAFLLGGGLLAGMFTTVYLGEPGMTPISPFFWVPALACLAFFWAFLRHISRVRNPFIQKRFLVGKGFGTVNLVNALLSGVGLAAISLVPVYATNRYGIGAFGAGTLLIAQGLAMFFLSLLAVMLLRRSGHRLPIYIGTSLVIVGLVLLAAPAPGEVSPWIWLATGTLLIGAGCGIMNPATRNAGLQLAPRASSTLAALRTMSLQIGQILVISVTGAVVAASTIPGAAQGYVYLALVVLLLSLVPVIRAVPEHYGRW